MNPEDYQAVIGPLSEGEGWGDVRTCTSSLSGRGEEEAAVPETPLPSREGRKRRPRYK